MGTDRAFMLWKSIRTGSRNVESIFTLFLWIYSRRTGNARHIRLPFLWRTLFLLLQSRGAFGHTDCISCNWTSFPPFTFFFNCIKPLVQLSMVVGQLRGIRTLLLSASHDGIHYFGLQSELHDEPAARSRYYCRRVISIHVNWCLCIIDFSDQIGHCSSRTTGQSYYYYEYIKQSKEGLNYLYRSPPLSICTVYCIYCIAS